SREFARGGKLRLSKTKFRRCIRAMSARDHSAGRRGWAGARLAHFIDGIYVLLRKTALASGSGSYRGYAFHACAPGPHAGHINCGRGRLLPDAQVRAITSSLALRLLSGVISRWCVTKSLFKR